MGKDTKELSDLARAALALDEELRTYQQLVGAATRPQLDPEKGLPRATRAAEEARACQERLGPLMTTLSEALSTVWAANQQATEQLQVRVAEIQKRKAELDGLLARYAALGEQARVISAAVQRLGATLPTDDAQRKTLVEHLIEIDAQMEKLVEAARDLARAARDTGMEELPRQIETLRQQLHAARNRVGFLTRQLRGETV